MFKSRIYLDYASLTPIDPRVTREVKAYSSFSYANPSSLYKEGVNAKKALAEGRQKVADYLHAHADEIIFTSGGTEANALALEGVGRAAVRAGFVDPINSIKPHYIISSIEHSSIIETANMLEKHGCEVTRLSVDQNGTISLDELKKSIKPNTVLVSIMMVNNEIGSIQPIKEIAKIVRDMRKSRGTDSKYPLLHTDAAQALYEEINMQNLGVDLLTLDGSKVYGPRGIGALYVRRNTPIEAIILGGGQESGLRSGTENIPGIMGFAKALELKQKERGKEGKSESERVAKLRTYFIDEIKKVRSDIKVNGDLSNSAPHIVNISIPGIDNEFLLFKLDAKGIACSTKSSCLRDEDESYVLKSIGANSATSLRFSFGRWTTFGDIKRAIKIIRLAL
ncbi:MAG: cysteine desulfurase family protein [Candidatus Pacebacteria bacterium]|nr:cysteine desulfurase family protein [Candidatus Paceibacterota bacterium]